MAGSLIPSLLAAGFFPDDVTVERWVSSDENGDDTFDTAHPVTFKARITLKMGMEQNEGGDAHTVRQLHFVTAGVYDLSSKDRFTLPVRFSTDESQTDAALALKTRQPKAKIVTQHSDENGPHHEKVYF